MSITVALDRDRTRRPLRLRLLTRLAICTARLLALLRPHLLTRVLTRLSRGAAPASSAQAHAARSSVLAASLSLNGLRSCLPRSVSIALLCRLQGVWPTWCVGVRAVRRARLDRGGRRTDRRTGPPGELRPPDRRAAARQGSTGAPEVTNGQVRVPA
jgi:hypothetical protein